tara:strand:- start:712 stop:1224 length:513 start_codon:yes stop_codon:yes gene_type:complete
MDSKNGHNIKNRKKPNDIFITPLELAKKHIDYIEYEDDDIWYDPFKNSGNYYNQFPNDNKLWSEILDNKDFFKFNEKIDIICSNPPYSLINKVLEKSVELNPKIISYLIGVNNLTTQRIEKMNNWGYGLKKMIMLKVHDWYGMSFIVIFEKGSKNCIDIDRHIYYSDKKK